MEMIVTCVPGSLMSFSRMEERQILWDSPIIHTGYR